ncbi:MAG: hypothetical protein ACRD2I_26120, partial [Vicinamibacterales bacterium]
MGILVLLMGGVATPSTPRALSKAPGNGAFLSFNPDLQTWTIGNSRLRVTFRLTSANDLLLDQVFSPDTGRIFNSASAADSSITINGSTTSLGSASGGWTLDGTATSDTDAGVQLAFTFRSSKAPVTVIRSYASYPSSPTIETWTTVRATGTGSVSVSNLNVWQLTLPASTVHYALGLREDANGNPVDDAFTLQSATLDEGQPLTLASLNRSTEQYLPVMAADTDADEFYGGVLWSGSWQMTARRRGTDIQATAGMPTVTVSVDAAHPLEIPHGFFGFTPGGRSDVSDALRTFVVEGLRQGRGFEPLVTYNSWFAYGTEIDEEAMMNEMFAAASLGVELFVV